MKVTLCGKNGCCPSVEVSETGAEIGEGDEKVDLKKDEWNQLVEEVEKGKLQKI